MIRHMICGPMHWLGLVDLATPLLKDDVPVSSPSVTAFRLSDWFEALLGGELPKGFPVEDQPVLVGSDARLRVPSLAPRAVRYQLARFWAWEAAKDGLLLTAPSAVAVAAALTLVGYLRFLWKDWRGAVGRLLREKAVIVPGWINRLLQVIGRIVPRSLIFRVVSRHWGTKEVPQAVAPIFRPLPAKVP